MRRATIKAWINNGELGRAEQLFLDDGFPLQKMSVLIYFSRSGLSEQEIFEAFRDALEIMRSNETFEWCTEAFNSLQEANTGPKVQPQPNALWEALESLGLSEREIAIGIRTHFA